MSNTRVLKPDFAAGFFSNHEGIIHALADAPHLQRAAELLTELDELDCLIGTGQIALPMVLGELKTKCATPATNLVPEQAADG